MIGTIENEIKVENEIEVDKSPTLTLDSILFQFCKD
jgi:hypothetical protein